MKSPVRRGRKQDGEVIPLTGTHLSRGRKKRRTVPPSLREDLIEAFGNAVKAMIPLARQLESENFTQLERARVRELSDHDGVFRLANLLYGLCGERSRQLRCN